MAAPTADDGCDGAQRIASSIDDGVQQQRCSGSGFVVMKMTACWRAAAAWRQSPRTAAWARRLAASA
ncbi:hypothetical protein Dimus_001390, partial [Dionaea muscipula]